MTGTTAARHTRARPTLDEAARSLDEARNVILALGRDYDDIRRSSRESEITRARSEWGLALYVYADALVAREEARDREQTEQRRRAQEQAMQFSAADGFGALPVLLRSSPRLTRRSPAGQSPTS